MRTFPLMLQPFVGTVALTLVLVSCGGGGESESPASPAGGSEPSSTSEPDITEPVLNSDVLDALTSQDICGWFAVADLESLFGLSLAEGQPSVISDPAATKASGCFWSPSGASDYLSVYIESASLLEASFREGGVDIDALLADLVQRPAATPSGGVYYCSDRSCYLRVDVGDVKVQIDTTSTGAPAGQFDAAQADLAEQVLARLQTVNGS